MAEPPIEYIADDARKAWRTSHSKGLIDRAFRFLATSNPAEVIYIAEYATGNWDKAQFTGDPISVWSYRGQMFEEIEALGDLDRESPIASRTPVIRYCLNPNGTRMIHTIWNGVRAGGGHILRRVDGDWISEGLGWKS